MATSTPWGPSQHAERVTRGITFYGTAGHGGYKVSAKLNASMPGHLRLDDGWYEEDCDWSLVVTAFPQHFDDKTREAAKRTLKAWKPEAYEAEYGVTLAPGESYMKDARAKERL